MDDENTETEEEITKMFSDNNKILHSDEQLAIHIMHKFNIDRDTLESMPAFDKHLIPMFSEKKKQ